MEIKPTSELLDPKYKNIHIQTGIREYSGDLSKVTLWGLGGMPRKYKPDLKEILNELTVDQLRELYDAKRCTNKFNLEQEIEEAEEDIRSFTESYQDRMNYRKERITHLEAMLKSPRCNDPSAILHNIEIQIASKDVETEHYERQLKPMKEHLQRLNKRLFTFNTADQFSLSTLKRKAAEKFGVDISKPKPHPDALRDPLYHDDVTDKI